MGLIEMGVRRFVRSTEDNLQGTQTLKMIVSPELANGGAGCQELYRLNVSRKRREPASHVCGARIKCIAEVELVPFLPPDLATLLHAGFRIPGALLFARRDHFADVVGVVLSDTGHRGGDLCKRCVVCGLHELLQFSHYPIEFL